MSSALFAIACYAAWRLLVWIVDSRKTPVPWRRVRYLLPTAMLALLGLQVWAGNTINLSYNLATQTAAYILDVLNAPAVLAGGAVFDLFRAWPAGLKVPAAALCAWLIWYAIVRLLEYRAGTSRLLQLRLNRP
ncbi:MAG TPA: hypothetical protein VMZ52_12740 [Bryobacteraceae bacterium]|nr:hypothetical protein [Bryobacteraceae bacterium]